MKQKAKPESKIPTTQTNTNQKKKAKAADGLDVEGSLLKKNEFTLIIAGALVVTVLVFFLFFRSSGTDSATETGNEKSTVTMEGQGLEKRISALEVSLTRMASFSPDAEEGATSPKDLTALEQRISRLETAVTLKLDSMIARMGKMEKRMGSLKTASARKAAPVAKVTKKTTAIPEKAPVKKKTVQPKKTTTPAKKASLFHTVKKGETIWSISQKYKTSVAAIRKLNNLSSQDKIYPGNNILVR